MSERIHVFGPTYVDHTIRLKDNISLDGSARIDDEQKNPGGTGLCYAIALSRLENQVTLHSKIGTDEGAIVIQKMVIGENNLNATWQTENGPTDYAYILIDQGNHKAVASRKEISNRWTLPQSFALETAHSKAMVITSFSNNITREILTNTREMGGTRPFIMWAPHRHNCTESGILVPNLDMVNHISLSHEEFEILYEQIGNPIEHGVDSVTITNGKNGCELLTVNGTRHFDAVNKIENPLDTNGAGEAFGSGYVTAYLDTKDYETAIYAGSHVGSLHIQKLASDFPKLSKNELIKTASLIKASKKQSVAV